MKSKPHVHCFKNTFVKVWTGEGKSIVVAFTAVVLAKCGYEVDCICFRKLLVQRDWRDFEPLFTACGVETQIH